MQKLERIFLLWAGDDNTAQLPMFQEFVDQGNKQSNESLRKAEDLVDAHDVCNLQFTSGTTGNPKAAMLSHL